MRSNLLASAALLVACTLVPGVALAENLGKQAVNTFGASEAETTIGGAPEGYRAEGKQLGAFMVRPSVELRVGHSDNVLASEARKVGSSFFEIAPEIKAETTWSRHGLKGYIDADIVKFDELSDENTDDMRIGVAGRYDISRATQVTVGLEHRSDSMSRSNPSALDSAANPIEFDTAEFYIVGKHQFNRLTVAGSVDWMDVDYKPFTSRTGNINQQTNKDRDELGVTVRADYSISPDTAVFVEGTLVDINYKKRVRIASQVRDTFGTELLVGVSFDVSQLSRGYVGVGYIEQDYDDPEEDDISGLGMRAEFDWYPTKLTRVNVKASREFRDGGIAEEASFFANDVAVRVDHELLRNLFLRGEVFYGTDSNTGLRAGPTGGFLEKTRDDSRAGLSLSGTLLMNRNLGILVGADYYDFESGRQSGNRTRRESFDQFVFSAGLLLQY